MKTTTLALSAAVAVLAISACGGSGSKETTSSAASSPAVTSSAPTTSSSPSRAGAAASASLAVAADPSGQLKFTKSSLTAEAGKVTIRFTNNSSVAHNLTIQQASSGSMVGATPTVTGGTKTLTVTLKAGTYTFFCSVPGHRDAGMKGTLSVQ